MTPLALAWKLAAIALTFAEPVGPERSAFNRKLEYPKLGIA
jgi:hypothetical protein